MMMLVIIALFKLGMVALAITAASNEQWVIAAVACILALLSSARSKD